MNMQNNVSAASGPAKVRTPWSEFWRKFKRQRMTLFAGSFIGLLVLIAVFWPWIVPYDPENYFDYDMLNAGPSLQHWFGVDSLGRDIFSRILAGARISLAAGFSSVLVGAVVGTLLGLTSGYFEGWWDRVVMRVCDVLFAFPGILLAISVVAVLGSGMAKDCVVYGESRDGDNEAVCADVVPAGSDVTPEELIAYCAEHLSEYKCPQTVVFVDRIQKTFTGKSKKDPRKHGTA